MKKILSNIKEAVVDYYRYYKYSILANTDRVVFTVKRYFINLGEALIGRVQKNYRDIQLDSAEEILELVKDIRELETEIAAMQKKLSRKTATVAKTPAKKKKTSGK
jgi:hypothetical protein